MTETPGASRSPDYIPSLDGFRAISILLVFLSHVGLGSIVPGKLGVTIFFFISGYLITTLMLREYATRGTVSLRAFYLRRLLRLGPPLVLALGVALSLRAMNALDGPVDLPTLASQVFFYFNYFDIYGHSLPIAGTFVLWSLSVEEHFYLIWPALFLLFAQRRLGLGWIAALAMAFLLWRIARVHLLSTPLDVFDTLTDTRLDSLLYGCALALVTERRLIPTAMDQSSLWRALLLAGGFALLMLSLVWRDPVFRVTLRYSLQGIALMPIFYYAISRPELALFRPLNWPWVRKIGVWSYSFYLIHAILLHGLIKLMHPQPSGAGAFVWALTGGALSLIYAALVNRHVEVPLARLRKRLYGHASALDPAPPTR